MAVELGTAYVNVVPSTKGIEAATTRELLPMVGISRTVGAQSGAALTRGFGANVAGLKKFLPIAGFAAFGVAAFSAAKKVNEANHTIERTTGATGKALEGLQKSFRNVARRTPASFEQVSKSLAQLSQRTNLVGKPLEDLTLKVVTFQRITGQTAPIQKLTGVMAAFNIPAQKMGEQLDNIFKAGQQTGVPIQQLLGVLQIGGPFLRQFGFDLGQSAVLLGTLDKAGVPARITMTGLRIAFARFSREGKEPKQALRDLLAEIDRLGKAGKAAEARKLGVQVFGARGAGLVDAALQGKLNLDKLSKSLKLTGEGILETASKTSTLSGKFGILRNRAQLALSDLALPALNAANEAMKLLLPPLSGLIEGFNKLPQPVQTAIIGFTTLAVVLRPLEKLIHGVGAALAHLALEMKALFVGVARQIGFLTQGFNDARIAQSGFSGVMGTLGGRLRIVRDAMAELTILTYRNVRAHIQAAAAAVKHTVSLIAEAFAAHTAAGGLFAMDAAMLPLIGSTLLIVAAIAALTVGFILAYQHIKPFRDAVDGLARTIVGGLKAAFDWVVDHWKIIGLLLIAPFIGIPVLIAQHIGEILDLLRSFPALFVAVGRRLIGGLVEGIEWGIALMIVSIIGIPALIVTRLVPLAVRFFPIGVRWMAGLVRGFFEAVPRIIQFFNSLPGRIVLAVGNLAGILIRVGRQAIVGLLNGAVAGFAAVVQFFRLLPGRIVGLVGSGGEMSRVLFDVGVRMMQGLVTALTSALPALGRFFRELPGRIIRFVGDLGPEMERIGRAIVDGIIEGIGDIGEVVFHHIASGLGGVVDKVKTLLGIGSPSKVFATEVGAPIMQGIAQGIIDETPNTQKTAEQAVRDVTESARTAAKRDPGRIQVDLSGFSHGASTEMQRARAAARAEAERQPVEVPIKPSLSPADILDQIDKARRAAGTKQIGINLAIAKRSGLGLPKTVQDLAAQAEFAARKKPVQVPLQISVKGLNPGTVSPVTDRVKKDLATASSAAKARPVVIYSNIQGNIPTLFAKSIAHQQSEALKHPVEVPLAPKPDSAAFTATHAEITATAARNPVPVPVVFRDGRESFSTAHADVVKAAATKPVEIPLKIGTNVAAQARESARTFTTVTVGAFRDGREAFARAGREAGTSLTTSVVGVFRDGREAFNRAGHEAGVVGATGVAHGIRDGRDAVSPAAILMGEAVAQQVHAAALRKTRELGPISPDVSFRPPSAGAPTFGSTSDIIKSQAELAKIFPKQGVSLGTGELLAGVGAALKRFAPDIRRVTANYANLNEMTLKQAQDSQILTKITNDLTEEYRLNAKDAADVAKIVLSQAASQQAHVVALRQVRTAQIDLGSSNETLLTQLKDNKFSLDQFTQAGRDNRTAMQDVADKAVAVAQAQIKLKQPAKDVIRTISDQANTLEVLGIKSGLSAEAAAKLTAELLGMPPETVANITSNADLQKQIVQDYGDAIRDDVPDKKDTRFTATIDPAKQAMVQLIGALSKIKKDHPINFTSDGNTVVPIINDVARSVKGVPTSWPIDFKTTINGKFVNPQTGASIKVKGINAGDATVAVFASIEGSPVKVHRSWSEAGEHAGTSLMHGITSTNLTIAPSMTQVNVNGALRSIPEAGATVARSVQQAIDAAGVTITPTVSRNVGLPNARALLRSLEGPFLRSFGQNVQTEMAKVRAAVDALAAAQRRLANDQAKLQAAHRAVAAAQAVVNAARTKAAAATEAQHAAERRLVRDVAGHASAQQIKNDENAVKIQRDAAKRAADELKAAEKKLNDARKNEANVGKRVENETQALKDLRQAEKDEVEALRQMVDQHDALVAQLGTGFDKWLESLKLPPQYFDTIAQSAESMAQSVRSTFEQLTNVATGGLRGLTSGITLQHVERWAAAIRAMEDMGLAPQLIAQFIQAGPESFREAEKLVAGGQPLVNQLNATTGAIWAIEQQTFQQAIARNPAIVLPPWEQNPNLWKATGVGRQPGIQNVYNITGILDAKTAEMIADMQAWTAATAGSTA